MKNKDLRMCPCCMEHHDIHVVQLNDSISFKGVPVYYVSNACYCEKADEHYYTEEQIRQNNLAVRDAYRTKCGLLTSEEIKAVRNSYGMSQTDLCILLGWGEKTIARYETFQVQDRAHDLILRKLDTDPAWFIDLLSEARDKYAETSYKRFLRIAEQRYAHALKYYEISANKARTLRTALKIAPH